MKDSEAGECRSLRELELEVEAEMREWGRKRLQEKLQEQADRHGRVFPPEPTSDVARPSASDGTARQRGRA
jgi:hypothetical protein